MLCVRVYIVLVDCTVWVVTVFCLRLDVDVHSLAVAHLRGRTTLDECDANCCNEYIRTNVPVQSFGCFAVPIECLSIECG